MSLTPQQLQQAGLQIIKQQSYNQATKSFEPSYSIYDKAGGINYDISSQQLQSEGYDLNQAVDINSLPKIDSGGTMQSGLYGVKGSSSPSLQKIYDMNTLNAQQKASHDAQIANNNASMGSNAYQGPNSQQQVDALKTIPTAPVLPTTSNQMNLYSGAAGYSGPSIVDFLKTAGQPATMSDLQKLGVQYGIVSNPGQYTGTANQNTQLLNILKGFASGKVSNLGIPSTFANSGPATPATNTPLNASSLGGNGVADLTKILGVNVSNNTANSDIAGLISLYGATSESQKKYDELTTKLTDIMSSLGSEGADMQNEMNAQGVGQNFDMAKQLNLKGAQLQGELEKFDAETQQGISDISGQSIPTGLITGQQAQYNKQRDLTRLSKAAELSSTIALSQAYQGNAQLGLDLAKKSVDLKYQPIQNEIDVLKTQIGFAGDKLNKEDSTRSNIISSLITLKQNDLNAQKAKDLQIQTMAIQAASNGAPLSVVNAIKNATDPVTAASVGGKYLKGTLESPSKAGVGGAPSATATFTQTQENKGAANAGISINDFANLSDDSKNYYINNYANFNTILKDIQAGKEDAQSVLDEMNSSNLPQDVKDNLTKKLQPYIKSNSPGGNGFLQGVGNFFGGLWGNAKALFGV